MSNNNSINFNINILVSETPLTTCKYGGVFKKHSFVIVKNNSLNNLKHKSNSM